jgi:hypothetical protein
MGTQYQTIPKQDVSYEPFMPNKEDCWQMKLKFIKTVI